MVNIYTQLLLERYPDGIDEQARIFADHIQNGVARMERLIQEVLQYSEVIHQRQEWMGAPAPLRAVLDESIAVYRGKLDSAGARLEIGPLPTALAERSQIGLVFQNLISNALKYAHPGRPLCIRVWARRRGERWAIYFADNGIGFPPEFAERIFGLFKRLHGREVPGTGLGLAICRRIIERFGGEMWAESEAKAGATFILTLKGLDEKRCDDEASFADSAGRGQSR